MKAQTTCRSDLVLQEYEEGEVELSPEQERMLRRLARGRVAIRPGDTTGRWLVKASSYVGTIVTPDVRVLIKPKVSISNLFHLLEAGGRTIHTGSEVFDYESTDNLVPAFATFYARHLETAFGRGVPREYKTFNDCLAGVRGRIDLPAQRKMAGLPLPLACEFDEYTADTALNRILLGALARLLRIPGVSPSTRRDLHRLRSGLEEVAPVGAVDLSSETNFTRLNDHCRPAERLARLVLSDASMLDAVGDASAAVFLVDMNKVFEEFIEARLRRYLLGRLTVHGQSGCSLDERGAVRMKPDLVFRAGGQSNVYVADTKYKVAADGYGRESDYYQLLAYTTALNLTEGLLIYCQRDGDVPPRQVQVRHVGKRLRTFAVSLDGTPEDVEQAMRSLANHIMDRSTYTVASAGAALS